MRHHFFVIFSLSLMRPPLSVDWRHSLYGLSVTLRHLLTALSYDSLNLHYITGYRRQLQLKVDGRSLRLQSQKFDQASDVHQRSLRFKILNPRKNNWDYICWRDRWNSGTISWFQFHFSCWSINLSVLLD